MFIVMYGSTLGGKKIVGPFDDQIEAEHYASINNLNAEILPVGTPGTDGEEPGKKIIIDDLYVIQDSVGRYWSEANKEWIGHLQQASMYTETTARWSAPDRDRSSGTMVPVVNIPVVKYVQLIYRLSPQITEATKNYDDANELARVSRLAERFMRRLNAVAELISEDPYITMDSDRARAK